MTLETEEYDEKSLKFLSKNPDWQELAKDCVCFANARGGAIRIGIEDGETQPPDGQTISPDWIEKISKRINELTLNVTLAPRIEIASNGSQYLHITISRSPNVASTSDGRYYLRVADTCKPVLGDDILRLINERPTAPWETLTTQQVPRDRIDSGKLQAFCHGIRSSDRVKTSVKEKTDTELLDHYFLAQEDWLTNLGILSVGQRGDRARLGTAPVVQFLKYDQQEQKVNKLLWDDFSLSPIELVEAVWTEIPDFRERYELPDGLFRQTLPLYDEAVVRELLVNALVHRPYTQRGDIFLNLFSDRLEIVNPGPLPLGVTPQNVLHTTVRRNENLARIFHDLKLMEREGSGFDKIYEIMLSQGRRLPLLQEGSDRVKVTIYRQILKQEVINLLAIGDRQYQLTQREKITLGLLAQKESLSTRELSQQLSLSEGQALTSWLGRLLDFNLIKQTGQTKGTRYSVDPEMLRSIATQHRTTLQLMEPHRLEALILEDLRRYPQSSISEIHQRTAPELARSRIKRTLERLIAQDHITQTGENRWRRYSLHP
ncbi:ATP-binding protein [Roseofilum capinflatum]|uniref:ATP-binding protein n=1 Tax=Roseofilum capinflatum BLCC-M114 TaxID=3022440 RepID=A0ABT7B1H4_9CYAN|nr:ATP-binding protein [Roseofilum capinflatum]MDJ1172985.1 ATP-binding protein [Roseofilum capinflatum BLCC-M114]